MKSSFAERLLDQKRFDFESAAFAADKFAVVRMEGFEAISQPFRFTLTLVSDDPTIDFDAMLGHPARFVIYSPGGDIQTPYHGVLAEFDQLHRADGYVFYRAVLVPRLWRLSLYRISEAYLAEQPITATLEDVLKQGQLTVSDYAFKLKNAYRSRSFVCQYEETHLDFVSRWMENEGIHYYFDHDGAVEKLVAVDDKIMLSAHVVPIDYRPADELDTGVSGRAVRDFAVRQKPLPKEVILQDYNHRKAAMQLKASAPVADAGVGQVMLYGENFRDEAEGQRYAKLRAEEILCRGKVFSGEGTAVGLRSGYFARLSHHYRANFNGDYLITEIHHEGSQAGALLIGAHDPRDANAVGGDTEYRNSFRAIPAATQFRPERITPKPRIAGTMTATIDAEGSGDYAELDEFGQYKVQLPFNLSPKRPNKGSARMRMATPYSGSDHGMHFPLLKGAEVLLSFTDGDPDRPVIVGAVPNSENRSVVNQANPHENRIRTAGGNQVYMGDAKGKEVLWLHSPFHNSSIGIGSTDPNGGGSIWTSTAGSSESVTVGTDTSISAGGKNSISVGYESALAASFTNKFTLGTSMAFGASYDVAWKMGKTVTLDDSEVIALYTDTALQASKVVTISGGQLPVFKETIGALKNIVRASILTSLAVNAAAALNASLAISYNSSDKETGKSERGNPWSYVPSIMQGLVSNLSMTGVHLLLANASKAIAGVGGSTIAYKSNIKVDDGIDMTVGPWGVPPSVSRIELQPASIKLDSGIEPFNSALKLTPDSAELSTSAAGTVKLTHPINHGSATLSQTGFVAKSGTAKVKAETAAGASMECGPTSSVKVTANGVIATSGTATLELGLNKAELKIGGSQCTLTAVTGKVNCTLLQLC